MTCKQTTCRFEEKPLFPRTRTCCGLVKEAGTKRSIHEEPQSDRKSLSRLLFCDSGLSGEGGVGGLGWGGLGFKGGGVGGGGVKRGAGVTLVHSLRSAG